MRDYVAFLAGISLLASCSSKGLEDCPASNIFDDWGVLNSSVTFNVQGNKYFLLNPVSTVRDSLFYNANYSDSYFVADSTRIVLKYQPGDSIFLSVSRLYSEMTNPDRLRAMMFTKEDSLTRPSCILYFERYAASDEFYRAKPDSTFESLLKREQPLKIFMTDVNELLEPLNSQNYTWEFFPKGYREAANLCRRLNLEHDTMKYDSQKPDNLKNK